MAEGINVKFSATDAGFTGTVAKVNNSMKSMDDNTKKVSKSVSSGFSKMAKDGAAFAAGFLTINAAINGIKNTIGSLSDALDMGGRLNDLSARTGESAGKLLLLERAFNNAGSSAEKVGPVINKLQKFIIEGRDSASDQAKAMGRLGLSYNELVKMTPTEQLQSVARELQDVTNDTERGALAVKIFGKSGGELLPFLRSFEEGLNGAKNEIGSLAGVMDRSSEIFDTISDNLTVIKGKAVEVAAGFLEKATPALLSFTNSLAGVDGASWGASLMDAMLKVADVVSGIFVAPMKAVDAIGSALNAYFREAGNFYLNGIITGGKALAAFWTSEIPSMIFNYVSSALGKAYIDSQKILIDGLNDTIKFFEADFGKAIATIVDFIYTSFKTLAKLFGTDLLKALTSPIDFVTGKLASSFADSAAEGGLSFKSAFSEGITTSLDRLSTGLDATSQKYGDSMSHSLDGVGSELGKIIEIVDASNKDFFGGAEATQKMKENIAEVEASGRKFRESLDRPFDMRKDFVELPKLTWDMKEHLKEGADALKSAAVELKTVSGSIQEKITEGILKDRIDPGGKLEGKANDALSKGDFRKAERAGARLNRRERDQAIQDQFGDPTRDANKSLQDMAKEQGIDRKGKSSRELRGELGKRAAAEKKRQEEMVPGQAGKNKEEAEGKGQEDGNAVLNEIKALVDMIKTTVNKIEPKLPTAALGA